jgi:hypothetical protein
MTATATPAAQQAESESRCSRIREELAAHRWIHLSEPLDSAQFDALLLELGTITRNMDIVVSADREQAQQASRRNNLPRPSIYQATGLDFHTDPPPAEILAFHCITQDEIDGASLLIDLGHLADDFSPEEIDGLCNFQVAYSVLNSSGTDELAFLPLLSRHDRGPTVNYMPWGIRRPAEPGRAALLEKFERYLRERPVHAIRLNPGESLFVDNHRVLHGRGPVAPDSRRFLRRVHVKLHPF